MSARGPFRSPPSFPPPLRFGQPAVFGQGGGPAGLPFAPAATFAPPYALGQAPAPAGNAGFSFRPPTSLGGFPTSSEASGGGVFASPEFRFKAPESAAAFKPLSGGEAEKGPAAPAAFTFSSSFAFASETGPEAAVAREPFSFSRPAAALGRPEERGLRVLPEDPGEPPSKGLKRKEERERSPRRAAAGGRAAAPPEKRAVMLSRPRGGILFGRTLEDLLRSQAREQRERGDGPEAERGPAEEPPPAEAREPAQEGGWESGGGKPSRPGVSPLADCCRVPFRRRCGPHCPCSPEPRHREHGGAGGPASRRADGCPVQEHP